MARTAGACPVDSERGRGGRAWLCAHGCSNRVQQWSATQSLRPHAGPNHPAATLTRICVCLSFSLSVLTRCCAMPDASLPDRSPWQHHHISGRGPERGAAVGRGAPKCWLCRLRSRQVAPDKPAAQPTNSHPDHAESSSRARNLPVRHSSRCGWRCSWSWLSQGR